MNTLLPTGRFVVPDIVATHFHLAEGERVADFGAGSGFFLKVLSEGVGQSGRVYACEIQKVLVEKLGDYIRTAGLQNVEPMWCDLEEPNGIPIPDSNLDKAMLINTLFQIEDKPAAIREMGRTLRRGGLLYVIDWTESFGGLGPTPDTVISAAVATDILESNGFVYEREFDAGDHHYGYSFRKQ